MNWNQYSKRRGKMSLEAFVSGCVNEQEAIERFAYRRIEDPPVDEIRKIFENRAKVVDESSVEKPAPEEVVYTPSLKKTKVTSGSTGE